MEFSLAVRVYYEDTDAGGVVYYANYLKFFERGRAEALRELGFEQGDLIAQEDVIFAVRSIHVEYLLPARLDDGLNVVTRISRGVGKASLEFEQIVALENECRVLTTATAKIACLRASTLKPRAIPKSIVRAMEIYSAG